MEKLTLSEVIASVNGKLLSGNTDTVIEAVCIDSRKISKNCLFIPLVGENADGHDFIKDSFELGAVATLVQVGHKIEPQMGALIQVKSTKQALQDLAKYYRGKFSIPVIGVTGSVGKTTTKEMIAAALGVTLEILKTPANYNGQIGLPLTLFELNKSHQAAVIEMGISMPGEMEKLADIADPDIGIITNIGLSHIENFKTVENTCSEKLKMLKKKNAKFYLNGDSPQLADLEEKLPQKIIYFGINGAYPYKCQDICAGEESTEFVLITNEFRENITIPCPGLHNVYNALAAIAVAKDLGIHMEDIKKGLLSFTNINMRQQISHFGNITLIDDSYNASPDSVKSSISILRGINSGKRNIAVMADMLELGENSPKIHFDTGRYIAIEGTDILITIGENAEFMSEGAKFANPEITAFNCETNKEAFEKLKEIVSSGDKILIKGSRGMHTDEISKMMKEYLSLNTVQN